MIQGIADADLTPDDGVWLLTRGAQVLERERSGEIAGAILWGLGKVVDLEAPHLKPRLIDLDPALPFTASDFVHELLHPDSENHIAYRYGLRLASRLERSGKTIKRLPLPSETPWVLKPDEAGESGGLRVELPSTRP